MSAYKWYYNHQSQGEDFDNPRPGLQNNAINIADFFIRQKGWSLTAVAGLLGNMAAESGVNPSRLQKKHDQPDYEYPPGGYPSSFDGEVTPQWTWTFARSPEGYNDRILGWGLTQWTSTSNAGQYPKGINWIIRLLHSYLGMQVTRRSYFDAYMSVAYSPDYAAGVAVWNGFGILDYELYRLYYEQVNNDAQWSVGNARRYIGYQLSFTQFAYNTSISAYDCGVLFGVAWQRSSAIIEALNNGQTDGGTQGRRRGNFAIKAYNWLIRNGYGSGSYPTPEHDDSYYGMYDSSGPGPGPDPGPQGNDKLRIYIDSYVPECIDRGLQLLEFQVYYGTQSQFIQVSRQKGSVGWYQFPSIGLSFGVVAPHGLHLKRIQKIPPQPGFKNYYEYNYFYGWTSPAILKKRLPVWYNGHGVLW